MDILKLDESCISNPKSEISDWTSHPRPSNLLFRILDLRCRIRPISKPPLASVPDYLLFGLTPTCDHTHISSPTSLDFDRGGLSTRVNRLGSPTHGAVYVFES